MGLGGRGSRGRGRGSWLNWRWGLVAMGVGFGGGVGRRGWRWWSGEFFLREILGSLVFSSFFLNLVLLFLDISAGEY